VFGEKDVPSVIDIDKVSYACQFFDRTIAYVNGTTVEDLTDQDQVTP
jgi:hypothetical protein